MKKNLFNDVNVLLYGGDYNPEQWLDYPDILDKDIKLLQKAKINSVSMGIFSWAKLEPREGVFTFDWMDNIINRLHENNIRVILATPSGARPSWLSEKYPEVLRKDKNRVRAMQKERHNHCYTSPIYREKVRIINQELAKRYGNHPGVILWHISNEYGGHCYCDLCEDSFRVWLRKKYGTLDKLNHEWWTTFWSKTYTEWNQIHLPHGISETAIQALNLDFRRFITDQTIDFYNAEVSAIKEIGTTIPFTTNFMGTYDGLDYMKFADEVDVVCHDIYPSWHSQSHLDVAMHASFIHSLYRSLKMKPFLLMESTPSTTNWHGVSKLKKPGMNILSSIQAIAEGSDSVLYFQIRQSRGSSEKFHSAVISHDNSEENRVFKEVVELGNILSKLSVIQGTTSKTDVAIVYDWPNRWAINESQGPRNIGMHYQEVVKDWFNALYTQGIQSNIVGKKHEYDTYKLLIVPMMYMVDEEYANKLKNYVQNGGTLITTYFTGYVNNNDLCHLEGFPGPLKDLLGITINEIDSLYDFESNTINFIRNNLALEGSFLSTELCELITLDTAETFAVYNDDFYKDTPAITINKFGKGKAIHIGTRSSKEFYSSVSTTLVQDLCIDKALDIEIPNGVSITARYDNEQKYTFVMNFNNSDVVLDFKEVEYKNILDDTDVSGKYTIGKFGFYILTQK